MIHGKSVKKILNLLGGGKFLEGGEFPCGELLHMPIIAGIYWVRMESGKTDAKKTWHQIYRESRKFGDRLADAVARGMGSWGFIILQTLFVIVWMAFNIFAYMNHWDPYPFILLNLLFSTQAAYAAPIIMMAQNRQAERDRVHAEQDYETNRVAKEEIEALQIKLNSIDVEKLDKIIALLEKK